MPNHIILTHIARNNRTTHLSFTSEHEAQLMAWRMKRSPKTKAVELYHSVLPEWKPNELGFHDKDNPSLIRRSSEAEPNVWFRVWQWITDKCRIAEVES